jgi:hypothetical protein
MLLRSFLIPYQNIFEEMEHTHPTHPGQVKIDGTFFFDSNTGRLAAIVILPIPTL